MYNGRFQFLGLSATSGNTAILRTKYPVEYSLEALAILTTSTTTALTSARLLWILDTEQAAHNTDYISYCGLGDGVLFVRDMPEEAQRGLTYENEDTLEQFGRDGIGRRREPGAMALSGPQTLLT
jgi:hypothetical protein